jgi:hypothetical protein
MSERFSCPPLLHSTKSVNPQIKEGLKGVPSVLGIKPLAPPLSKEKEGKKDKTISIYQRSVPAHAIKSMGRADPTICIAGCSKGGRGQGETRDDEGKSVMYLLVGMKGGTGSQ